MEELIIFVHKVKTALEDEAIKKGFIGFHDFPLGACMDASTLLGILLYRNGFGVYQLISATNEKGKWFSHSWLENEKYLIDITANQFNNWPDQTLVINLDHKPKHYQLLKIQFRHSVLQDKNVKGLEFYVAMDMVINAIQA